MSRDKTSIHAVVGFVMVFLGLSMLIALLATGPNPFQMDDWWYFHYTWQFYYTNPSLYVFLGYTLPPFLGVSGFTVFWIGFFILKGVEREARPVPVKEAQ